MPIQKLNRSILEAAIVGFEIAEKGIRQSDCGIAPNAEWWFR